MRCAIGFLRVSLTKSDVFPEQLDSVWNLCMQPNFQVFIVSGLNSCWTKGQISSSVKS